MTDTEQAMLIRMANLITLAMDGHDDNTNLPCRIDFQGHDCCLVCNETQTMMEALDADDEKHRQWYLAVTGGVPAGLPLPLRSPA